MSRTILLALTLLAFAPITAFADPLDEVNDNIFRAMERADAMAQSARVNSMNSRSLSASTEEMSDAIATLARDPNTFCMGEDEEKDPQCVANLASTYYEAGRRANMVHTVNHVAAARHALKTTVFQKQWENTGLTGSWNLFEAGAAITEPGLHSAGIGTRAAINATEMKAFLSGLVTYAALNNGSEEGTPAGIMTACMSRRLADGKSYSESLARCSGGAQATAGNFVAEPDDSDSFSVADLPEHSTHNSAGNGGSGFTNETVPAGTQPGGDRRILLSDILFNSERHAEREFENNGEAGSNGNNKAVFDRIRDSWIQLVGDFEFTSESVGNEDYSMEDGSRTSAGAISTGAWAETSRRIEPSLDQGGKHYRAGANWFFRKLTRNVFIKLNSFVFNMCQLHNDSVALARANPYDTRLYNLIGTANACGLDEVNIFDNDGYLNVEPTGTFPNLNHNNITVTAAEGSCRPGGSTELKAVTPTDLSFQGFQFGRAHAGLLFDLFKAEEDLLARARKTGGGTLDNRGGTTYLEYNCTRVDPYVASGTCSAYQYAGEANPDTLRASAPLSCGSDNIYKSRYVSRRNQAIFMLASRIAAGQVYSTYLNMLQFLGETTFNALTNDQADVVWGLVKAQIGDEDLGDRIDSLRLEIHQSMSGFNEDLLVRGGNGENDTSAEQRSGRSD